MRLIIFLCLVLAGCDVKHYGTVDCSGEVIVTINEEQLAALTALFADNPETVSDYLTEEQVTDIIGFVPIHK